MRNAEERVSELKVQRKSRSSSPQRRWETIEPPSGQDSGGSPDKTLGEYLRRHREAKGITIEQVAATTKIKERIITAIEEDRYDGTPPVPVVRGFLKSIASELVLCPAELLSRFEKIGIKGDVEQIFPKWSGILKVPR